MRKVIYLVATSLDGRIAKADGTFDCFPAEGDHVADYLAALDSFDDVLMGRATYEVGIRMGVTNPYPRLRGHLFSRSLKTSPDENVRLVPGDAVEYVRQLKSRTGRDIYLCGGARLASDLLAASLIDEIAVKLNPLLIGAGIPLFSAIEQPLTLELTGHKVYDSGVLLLTYRVKGPASPPAA